jgi:hypothetical protein
MLGLARKVFTVRPVPGKLSADRRRRPSQKASDVVLSEALMVQLTYPVALFLCKMSSHRWVSVPNGMILRNVTLLERPSGVSTYITLPPSKLRLRFKTARSI